MVHIPTEAIAHLGALVESFLCAEPGASNKTAYCDYHPITETYDLYTLDYPDTAPLPPACPPLLPAFSLRPDYSPHQRAFLCFTENIIMLALTPWVKPAPRDPYPDASDTIQSYQLLKAPISIHAPDSTPITTEIDPTMPLKGSLQRCLQMAAALFETHDYSYLNIVFQPDDHTYWLYTAAELDKAERLNKLTNARHVLHFTKYELAHLLPASPTAPETTTLAEMASQNPTPRRELDHSGSPTNPPPAERS